MSLSDSSDVYMIPISLVDNRRTVLKETHVSWADIFLSREESIQYVLLAEDPKLKNLGAITPEDNVFRLYLRFVAGKTGWSNPKYYIPAYYFLFEFRGKGKSIQLSDISSWVSDVQSDESHIAFCYVKIFSESDAADFCYLIKEYVEWRRKGIRFFLAICKQRRLFTDTMLTPHLALLNVRANISSAKGTNILSETVKGKLAQVLIRHPKLTPYQLREFVVYFIRVLSLRQKPSIRTSVSVQMFMSGKRLKKASTPFAYADLIRALWDKIQEVLACVGKTIFVKKSSSTKSRRGYLREHEVFQRYVVDALEKPFDSEMDTMQLYDESSVNLSVLERYFFMQLGMERRGTIKIKTSIDDEQSIQSIESPRPAFPTSYKPLRIQAMKFKDLPNASYKIGRIINVTNRKRPRDLKDPYETSEDEKGRDQRPSKTHKRL